jgi:peptidoglycan hydrolase-like protein with peptidoglycan-binding domain
VYREHWQRLDGPLEPAHFEVRFGPGSGRSASRDDAPLSTDKPFVLDTTVDGRVEAVRQAAALRMLRAAGYLQGGVEGELDAAALSAIEIFQRQHGLPVDGLVSNALLVALGQQLDAGAALPENQEL